MLRQRPTSRTSPDTMTSIAYTSRGEPPTRRAPALAGLVDGHPRGARRRAACARSGASDLGRPARPVDSPAPRRRVPARAVQLRPPRPVPLARRAGHSVGHLSGRAGQGPQDGLCALDASESPQALRRLDPPAQQALRRRSARRAGAGRDAGGLRPQPQLRAGLRARPPLSEDAPVEHQGTRLSLPGVQGRHLGAARVADPQAPVLRARPQVGRGQHLLHGRAAARGDRDVSP